MERYNPFSNASLTEETDSFTKAVDSPTDNQSPMRYQSSTRTDSLAGSRFAAPPSSTGGSRYSTAFPDPFGDTEPAEVSSTSANVLQGTMSSTTNMSSNRSNSVTFAPSSRSVDDSMSSASPPRSSRREAGGLSSFLSRATSVTSSTVTDRVNEAVGSVRNAVDSISNQIQQAVPSNLNERISTTATNLISTSEQQQQSTASYLASKLSSATNQFTSSSPGSSSLPLISRQRVILILDSAGETDWPQQFINYRRLASGLGPATSNNALTSFFSSATAQLTSSPLANQLDGVDLVEQADFRDVSVMANQSSSIATVLVTSNSSTGSGTQSRLPGSNRTSTRIIRPEYVLVRQRTKNGLEHMRGIVTALNYCLVPMFEPMEIWNTFQDRRLLFAKLLRIQKTLGKESFPLIPQVYCQTHQDLMNYINSTSVVLPCLVRTGHSGKGKIKIDSIQTLKDFASIVATNNLSCTIEPYLDVKCDLVVQKVGCANLKLFRKIVSQESELAAGGATADDRPVASGQMMDQSSQFGRQTASRQTSLGSGVLSSLISSTTNQAQQISRRSSNPNSMTFEKLAEVNSRYRNWIDAIVREFDNKLEVLCVKLVVTNQDREYIVGLGDCSMDFLGSQESQDEDRNSFVELIINQMNVILPKTGNQGKETSTNQAAGNVGERRASDGRGAVSASTSLGYQQTNLDSAKLGDKKRFTSQTQINGLGGATGQAAGGQMGNRSQSVSMNQSDYMLEKDAINRPANRRGSERSDSLTTNESSGDGSSNQQVWGANESGVHQRQASLGQSFFDQTSTAFNTLQKQSMSFFKRLDSRTGEQLGSNTPPQSAKSDRCFETSKNSNDDMAGPRKNGFKSQSIDSWVSNRPAKRETPPKPPPPQCLGNRQSSLASYSAHSPRPTTSTTPASTRQNSTISSESGQRARVVRQNSALSAFEPFDPDLSLHQRETQTSSTSLPMSRTQSQSQTNDNRLNKQLEPIKKSCNYDSASITSGDSNSTSETTTAEDTMNNLKKTFASIFGDKCE